MTKTMQLLGVAVSLLVASGALAQACTRSLPQTTSEALPGEGTVEPSSSSGPYLPRAPGRASS